MTHPEPHKTYTIIVNGRERSVSDKDLTFAQVVELAFPGATPSETKIYTVTYSKGNEHQPQGSMVAGDTVKIKERMQFHVSATDRS